MSAPRFLFIGGTLSIDFVHTGGAGFRTRLECWDTTAGFDDWVKAALDVEVISVDAELEQAWELREAIWSAAHSGLAGRAILVDDIGQMHRMAGQPDLVPGLKNGERIWQPGANAVQALSTVARDAIDLFGTSRRERLRECQNPQCFLLFVDTSRPGRRAWCSMQRCGNLNKVGRYRHKITEPKKGAEA